MRNWSTNQTVAAEALFLAQTQPVKTTILMVSADCSRLSEPTMKKERILDNLRKALALYSWQNAELELVGTARSPTHTSGCKLDKSLSESKLTLHQMCPNWLTSLWLHIAPAFFRGILKWRGQGGIFYYVVSVLDVTPLDYTKVTDYTLYHFCTARKGNSSLALTIEVLEFTYIDIFCCTKLL